MLLAHSNVSFFGLVSDFMLKSFQRPCDSKSICLRNWGRNASRKKRSFDALNMQRILMTLAFSLIPDPVFPTVVLPSLFGSSYSLKSLLGL